MVMRINGATAIRERPTSKLYHSIGEVCELLGLEAHVLRYWESEFKMLRPSKNKSGNRAYRDKDIRILRLIKYLLYEEGYTIEGADRKLQKLLRTKASSSQTEIAFNPPPYADLIKEIKQELIEIRALLSYPPDRMSK